MLDRYGDLCPDRWNQCVNKKMELLEFLLALFQERKKERKKSNAIFVFKLEGAYLLVQLCIFSPLRRGGEGEDASLLNKVMGEEEEEEEKKVRLRF